MSFNRDIQIDPNRVQTRSGGGRGAMIGGGSILTVIAVVLISQLTGVDLSSMLEAQQQNGATRPTASSIDTSVCTSGDSANKYTQCRMVATAESLDAVWTDQLPAQAGLKYAKPKFVLWDGTQISSACGNASSAVGPFYCSGDQTVYLDMSFFSEMEKSLGATDRKRRDIGLGAPGASGGLLRGNLGQPRLLHPRPGDRQALPQPSQQRGDQRCAGSGRGRR